VMSSAPAAGQTAAIFPFYCTAAGTGLPLTRAAFLTQTQKASEGGIPSLGSTRKRHTFQRRSNDFGGAEGNRTPDLCSAIAALSHLSYGPKVAAI
jgi:hypothetical protein